MSVNGWFRIDPNSWHATGIPVGHPDRYKSRGVIRTTKDTTVPYEHQELGVPLRGKTVETDADKELKKLLKRQLDTSFDVSTSSNDSRFSSSSNAKEESVVSYSSGLKTLEELKKDVHEQTKKPKLSKSRANPTDIENLVKERQNGRLVNPEHLRKEIQEELNEVGDDDTQPSKETETAPLSRRVLELERSLLANKKNVPLAHLYADKQKQATSHEPQTCNTPILAQDTPKTPIAQDVQSIPEENILSNRLSLQQIKELPKFENYAPGVPSKNLHKKVDQIDLLSLFIRFQAQEKIKFKLMRGQAFVTFADTETAQNAFNLVNGYVLKDRAIVIEYGKNA